MKENTKLDPNNYITEEDSRMYNSVKNRFGELQEEDSMSAYKLMIDAIQTYNRFSYIKQKIRENLTRGQQPELKDRLTDMCKYLKEVHVTSRMIWKNACDDMRNIREDL